MEGKKIKNCGEYAMALCVVGSNEKFRARFAVGTVYGVGINADGVFVRADQGVLVYESSARFVEHVAEVQLCEPHADDDIKAYEDMEALQLSEPDYAPVEQDDVLGHARANSPIKPMGNPKYDKTITGKYNTGTCTADVYRILEGFNVTNPQLQHLIKKALNVGARGHKDERQDLVDILHSAQSALDMYDDKNGTK